MNYRLQLLEKAVEEISLSLKGIQQTLANYAETKNALERAFGKIGEIDKRMDDVEKMLPIIKLTSRWVLGGMGAVVFMVGAAAFKVIFGG